MDDVWHQLRCIECECVFPFVLCYSFHSFASRDCKKKKLIFQEEEVANVSSRCMLAHNSTYIWIHLFASSLLCRAAFSFTHQCYFEHIARFFKHHSSILSKPWIYSSSFLLLSSSPSSSSTTNKQAAHIFASKLLIICLLKREKTIWYSYFNE